MGGHYNNKNSGKRGISLNIRHPKGLKIAKRLVAISDIVAEGFSPGVLDRLGLGYDVQRKIRPDIIYVQQSGMGGYGSYGRLRTVGPIAGSFAGTNHMSGLPEPAMPAGWGYSYLDWMGAYGFAQALLGALYYRSVTGKGQRDRRLAMRGGHLSLRAADPRMVGQWTRMGENRQSLAPWPRRPAWRLPLQGR